jgi:two-component system cell cycle sensor histidine kinase/response regulator CckA
MKPRKKMPANAPQVLAATPGAHAQTKPALRESEEHYRNLLQNNPAIAVQGYGMDGITTFWNQASERLYGYTASEAIGRSLLDLIIPPEMRVGVSQAIRQMAETGQPIPAAELSLMGKDGSRVSVFSSHSLVQGTGRATELFCFDIDLTESKQAEAALRDALTDAQRFRQALDQVSAYIYMKDSRSRYVYANRATLELFGCSATELVGSDDTRFFPPGTVQRLQEIDSRVFRGEQTTEEIDVTDARVGRRVYWETKSPIYAGPGNKTIWGLLGISTDITGRKRTEEALLESEERYQRITEAITDYIYTVHVVDGRAAETTHGPGCLAVTGYQMNEFAHDPYLWLRMVAAADRSKVEEQARRILAGEDPPPIEHHIVHKNGTVRWVRNTFVPHRDEHGCLVAYDGLIQDITARKQVEESLHASEAQNRALLNAIPDFIFTNRRDGEYLAVQTPDPGLLFIPPETFLHRKVEEVMPKPIADLFMKVFADAHALGAVQEVHYTLRMGGEEKQFEARVVPSTGDKVISIVRDITEQKRAETALRESETVLRESQIIAGLGSYVLDISTGIWSSSAVLDLVFGIDETYEHSVAGWEAIIHHADRAMMADYFKNEVLGRRQAFNKEYRIVRRDNQTVRWVHGIGRLEFDAEGRPRKMLGTIQDITGRKQAEAERQQLERKLLETQKLESLGVLAGGIAHDFNNILTGILGNATLASLDLPAGSPVHDNLETIRQASLRAADLCKQMLAYSGKGRFVVQNLSLNGLVEETTHLLQISISKKAVLRFNLYPALPPIEADATQLRQVIMNLVINASEAIGEKSGVISLSTGLARVDRDYLGGTLLAPELPEGTYVFLEVADSGCGMSPETQAKIFDPFFTTKFAGRGLGLAAVLGIMRGHKGALKIHSEPGQGTTFKLLFPCAAGDSELIAAESVAKPAWRGHGCVLVADDEESVRSTTALMLRKLGFEVALAADGREAVEIFRAEPDRFTLVLMDLTMPHLDGEQAFAELRQIREDVRVVLMSGFNEQEVISRFSGKGMGGFLQKPFAYEGLSNVAHRVLVGAPETK